MSSAPQQPPQEPVVTQRYQPPQGAIPIERLKRVAIGLGILVLALLTLWGSCHKPPVVTGAKKLATQVSPMSPSEVDSQQAELSREMDEAKRAAQQAELAKQRAQHMSDDGNMGPRTAQVDPAVQLQTQLRLEDLRRQHQAAYASTVAFAAQKDSGSRPSTAAEPVTQPGAQVQTAQIQPKGSNPADNPNQTPPAAPPSQMQVPDLPPGTYRLDEGTVIETILLNRLEGEFAGPVITQVSANVYSRAGIELLIPKGSRLLGEAREVNSFDQRRLAIFFHRLILPNQKSLSLDKFRGLDQIGETGVASKVDHHYLEIFGTSLALGGIGGLMQIGSYGGYGYDPALGFRVGFTERMGSSAEQVLAKFLNKLPTIKVLEGTRIKVILTNDLTLEAYE
jgi:type IV secretion system protein VirB10